MSIFISSVSRNAKNSIQSVERESSINNRVTCDAVITGVFISEYGRLNTCFIMTNKLQILLVCLIILNCSCSSYKYGANEINQKGNLTYGMVKSKIIKGQTTQSEILDICGSPNLVTKNKNRNEVWNYSKMSVVSKGGNSYFFDGERASYSSSTSSFDLIITFDEDDIVLDYSVISSRY